MPSVRRAILGKVNDFVVVRGPFPDGMFRSLTANSVKEALSRSVMEVRHKTSRDDQYALVRVSDVLPELPRYRDLGPMEL